jgi:hypothetical protein
MIRKNVLLKYVYGDIIYSFIMHCHAIGGDIATISGYTILRKAKY